MPSLKKKKKITLLGHRTSFIFIYFSFHSLSIISIGSLSQVIASNTGPFRASVVKGCHWTNELLTIEWHYRQASAVYRILREAEEGKNTFISSLTAPVWQILSSKMGVR